MKRAVIFTAAVLMTISLTLAVGAYTFEWPAFSASVQEQKIGFTAIKGMTMSLSAAELEQKLTLPAGSLDGITVTNLPSEESGIITVGLFPVSANMTLDREQLDKLTVAFFEDCETFSFGFVPHSELNGTAVPTLATISVLPAENTSPYAENTSFSTIQNVTYYGKVPAIDNDGDVLSVNITDIPDKGAVSFDGVCFRYTPFMDETGKDSFRFIVLDSYGHKSRECTVDIKIEKSTSFIYADMTANPHQYAAIKLAEKNVYIGRKAGNAYFLSPESEMNRGDYIVMLINAACVPHKLSACVNTGLINDSEIPMYLKPYIKLAMDMKIVTGSSFRYNQVPTNAEAVVMAQRALNLTSAENYTNYLYDAEQIPSWAQASYKTLLAYRILDCYDNMAHASDALTNDSAVGLAWQIWKYANG